jgi:ribosome-associated protein
MSRKLKKGYYVRGEFVAEGSERDLELKAELKGGDEPSRTELKRESDALQKLGTELLTLRADLLERLPLPDKLRDALAQAKRITNFEGKRRQMQFIGKLMRQLEPEVLTLVRNALHEQASGSAAEIALLHTAEAWRTRLLANDEAMADWMAQHPATDAQQLRAWVRQARKDAVPELPGAAPRHGRAYRDIFQCVKDALAALPEPEASAQRPAEPFDFHQEAS